MFRSLAIDAMVFGVVSHRGIYSPVWIYLFLTDSIRLVHVTYMRVRRMPVPNARTVR